MLDAAIPSPVSENGKFGGIDLAICLVDKGKIHSRYELDVWVCVWVRIPAGDLEAVYSVLVNSLEIKAKVDYFADPSDFYGPHTCPGPIIVPFQLLIMISSPSSRPYEHDPSPIPFSPFSSSSRRRKFLGTETRWYIRL